LRDLFIAQLRSIFFGGLIHKCKVALLPSMPRKIVRIGNDLDTIIFIQKVDTIALVTTLWGKSLFTFRNPVKQATRTIAISFVCGWGKNDINILTHKKRHNFS
jgi:hypothetical protein